MNGRQQILIMKRYKNSIRGKKLTIQFVQLPKVSGSKKINLCNNDYKDDLRLTDSLEKTTIEDIEE